MEEIRAEQPSLWKWILKVAASVGLTGMICCVAPAVLFMFGLMSGVYAISFANFFYQENGEAGTGAWVLRGAAAVIAIIGIMLFRRKQNQCSVDPKRKRQNLILVSVMIILLGVGFFLTLEQLTTWYFNAYVDPAKQAEEDDANESAQAATPQWRDSARLSGTTCLFVRRTSVA